MPAKSKSPELPGLLHARAFPTYNNIREVLQQLEWKRAFAPLAAAPDACKTVSPKNAKPLPVMARVCCAAAAKLQAVTNHRHKLRFARLAAERGGVGATL